MKALSVALCIAVALPVAPALAQEKQEKKEIQRSAVHVRQQARMAECNKEAGTKTGRERTTFMNGCLKANEGDTRLADQQSRIRVCSAEAADKGLTGDARMKYMATCSK
jgi:hypothetical protein